MPFLPGIGRLDATVEEVRHVGVFLGLGDVELAPAGLGEGLRQRASLLGREGDRDREPGFEFGHRHDEQVRRRRAAIGRGPIERHELSIGEGVDQLARPIRPEIGVDQWVAAAHGAIDAVDDRRGEEFVVLAALVAGLDRCHRAQRVLAHAVDDRVVAALDPVPAAVAIHRPVAAGDRGDVRVGVGRREPAFEVGDEADGGSRRRIAAIEQGVDPDARHAPPRREVGERDEVPVVGMDAARPDEADEVETAARVRGSPACLEERRALEEAAVGDRGVDPRQVLEDRPAGTEVEMTDLGVAHLPRRQADRALRGAQDRVWPVAQEPSPGRHRGGRDRIGGRVAADPEPVEDDEDDRPGPAAARRGRAGFAGSVPPSPPVTRPRRGPRRSARPGRRCRPSRRP